MLLSLLLISIIFNGFLIYFSYGLPFFNKKNGTDNEKMLVAASQYKITNWLSKIHEIKNARSELREIWVLFLAIMIKIFKFPKREFTNVTLSLLSNFGINLIIFLIFENLYNPLIGFITALTYTFCFWSYQVGIYLGHILLSSFFALLSLYLIILIDINNNFLNIIYSFLAGFFLIISFSSSSASRKYPPLIIYGMFLFNLDFFNFNKINFSIPIIILFFILYFLSLFGSKFFSSFVINTFKRKLNKKNNNFDNYLKYVNRLQWLYLSILFIIILFLILFLDNQFFISCIIFFIFGSLFGGLLILMPNLYININRYRHYLNIGKWANHFNSIDQKYFNKKLDKNMRGGGAFWLVKFFFDFMPIHILLIIYCNFKLFVNDYFFTLNNLCSFIFMIIPLIVMELSKAIRVAKSYFPILVSFLFYEAFLLNSLKEINKLEISHITAILLILVIYNFRVFIGEVFFNRFYPIFLYRFLKKNKIKEFSTYNNFLNNSVLTPFLDRYDTEFKVHYVNDIESSKTSIFIIPPISSKSVSLETNEYVYQKGNFSDDQKLNNLIVSGKLNSITLKTFKTLASSTIFVLESEVTGFRHYFLEKVNRFDRYLGLLRIVKL